MQDTLFSRSINKKQIIIGLVALFIGSLVYLIDRPSDKTYLVYSIVNISLYNTLPNLFGLISNILPAFIHVFSFILITAGLIFYNKRGYLIIYLSWFLIDCVFELGQNFNTWSSSMIPNWFTGIPFLENIENYFLQGTFDFIDLAAIAFGTVIAYFVLLTTDKREVMP